MLHRQALRIHSPLVMVPVDRDKKTASEPDKNKQIKTVTFKVFHFVSFQNQDGKLIVVYDNDELIATRVASTLVQRGYDNVFMLSGGLKVAQITFPEGLVKPQASNEFTEEDIASLEEFLEEALARKGTSRLSSYAPSVCGSSRLGSSRSMSLSQPNLFYQGRSGMTKSRSSSRVTHSISRSRPML